MNRGVNSDGSKFIFGLFMDALGLYSVSVLLRELAMFQLYHHYHQHHSWGWLLAIFLFISSPLYAIDDLGSEATIVIPSPFVDNDAERAPIKRVLTMLVRGSGSGRIKSTPAGVNCNTDCTAQFNDGRVVTLKATPAAGSILKKWGGACLGVVGDTCRVTMSAAKTARAVFALSIPNQPANLQATAGDKQVTLNWTASAGATAYDICMATESISDFNNCNSFADGELLIDQVSPTVIDALDNGVEYYFKVVARNSGGSSPSSAEVSATPQASISLGAGNLHTCATVEGESYCWGYNNLGQLGDGSTTSSTTPEPVAMALQALQIDGGYRHTCAVAAGGVKCWGLNNKGQLGDGTTTNRTTPVTAVDNNSGATQVGAGYEHSCAIVQGAVDCWGDNTYGQTGSLLPTTGVTSITAGYYHNCAVLNGGVKCWGRNNQGQLGNGTNIDSATPVETIPANSGVLSISAGNYHTCALLNGGVQCWGENNDGQLGNASNTNSNVPVRAISANRGANALSAGAYHTCTVINGGVQCWGWNGVGQLGDRSVVSKNSPVNSIIANSGATSIVTGHSHSCALVRDDIKCWGYNGNGQFGNGTTTNSNRPIDGATF